MYTYENTLTEIGVTASKLSPGLKSRLKELKAAIEELEQAQEDESYDGDLDTLEETVNQLDEDLSSRIVRWNERKDEYAAKAKHLQNVRADKKSSDTVPIPVPDPKIQPQVQPKANDIPLVEAEVVEDENKKSGGWVAWALVGLIAIVTVGRVIMNDRE